MKLDYFDLLSPEPIYFRHIGGIKSPTLREISKISYNTYQMYLSVLLMDSKAYYDMAHRSEEYEAFSDEQKLSLNIFELITQDIETCSVVENMLNFFMEFTVRYSEQYHAFLLYNPAADSGKKENPSGIIQKDIWPQLCDIILQRNYIRRRTEDLSAVKSKKALSILQKLQKGRENKKTKTDKNMEIANIISAVANRSNSLNIINIWDITVYQLWDAFYRICNNNMLAIQSMSVAAWGDKDHHFDAGAWFRNLTAEAASAC